MKRLWLSIFLSLGIHAILMGLDTNWFKFLPQPTPHPNLVTISLVALQPKGDPKASRTEKPEGTIEKKAKPFEKKEPPPSKEVVKQIPEKAVEPKKTVKPLEPPAKTIPTQQTIKPETPTKQDALEEKIAPKQKPAAKPVIPPVKAVLPKPTKKKERPVKAKVPKKIIKPKKSLKKMTKKPQKATPPKEVAKIITTTTPKPVKRADTPAKKATSPPQKKAPSGTVQATTQKKPQNASGKEPASEDTPSNESVTMATKGDPSARAGLIMARPLYRKNPPPNYPRRARREGHEGNVILEVLVDEKGKVMELKVFKSSGYESLDQSALSSVRKWLFEPGTRNGKRSEMWVRVPIRFKLN